MNDHTVPIAELVHRARGGDVDSWSVLVAEFQDVAAGLAAGWSGDWTVAEDIAQEAFLAQPFVLWEHQTSVPGESTPYDETLRDIEAFLGDGCLP